MLCPICGQETESVLHILWDCISTQDVWACGPMKLQKSSFMGENFIQIFIDIRMRCNKEEMELMAILARRIWLWRNSMVYDGELSHPIRFSRRRKIILVSLEDTVNGVRKSLHLPQSLPQQFGKCHLQV
jgi:hypothetical protein